MRKGDITIETLYTYRVDGERFDFPQVYTHLVTRGGCRCFCQS